MSATVTLYSTPTCPFCHQAQAYFKEQGVAYTEFDVSTDESKADEMIEKSGQMGVPVIEINGKIVVGFDKMRIMELLNNSSV